MEKNGRSQFPYVLLAAILIVAVVMASIAFSTADSRALKNSVDKMDGRIEAMSKQIEIINSSLAVARYDRRSVINLSADEDVLVELTSRLDFLQSEISALRDAVVQTQNGSSRDLRPSVRPEWLPTDIELHPEERHQHGSQLGLTPEQTEEMWKIRVLAREEIKRIIEDSPKHTVLNDAIKPVTMKMLQDLKNLLGPEKFKRLQEIDPTIRSSVEWAAQQD